MQLATWPGERAFPLLRDVIHDVDPAVRAEGVRSLASFGHLQAFDAIVPMVADASPAVRAEIADAAIRFYCDSRADSVLESLRRDVDPEVRNHAELAVHAIEEIRRTGRWY